MSDWVFFDLTDPVAKAQKFGTGICVTKSKARWEKQGSKNGLHAI